MPKQFSLQPVLNYRHRIVESLEIALAQLLAAEQMLKVAIQKLHLAEQDLFGTLAQRQIGILDMMTINQLRAQIRGVQLQITALSRQLNDLQPQITAKRQEVVLAQQAKETLEKLKARERERWLAEEARREAAERDDIYIAQAYQKSQQ
ncbi:MAG: hypothetical protein FJ030_06665 [Chloroflexi bacterium]|nr:hypothetical protein [Chloroflexota bacterium]